ncbi:MAG: IS200/IS605 family transposase [Fusobacterium varium]|uniref:IS200/IS605 family transposase n=1 Tax=Fusobacterium varium TaxID=856 RepID=UPI0024312A7C|nr:IS200/IS605 family transposase [Fusobacterium varium]UYI77266.1 MAG: IS200/IS605 family transposase [Fusobacterium varium]
MSNINFGRGYVYSIQYHMVWCVKYRYKILNDDIDKSLKEIIKNLADEINIKIIEYETDEDHIHLLIECSPQHFIPTIVKILKGSSARKMFVKYPELKKRLCGGNLWNPSYFVATVSENTEEQIRKYIQTQKIK